MELREHINKSYMEAVSKQKIQSVCKYRNTKGQEFIVYVNPPTEKRKVTCTSKNATNAECKDLAIRLARLIL